MTPRSIAILAAPLAAVTILLIAILLITSLTPWWLAILLPIAIAGLVAAFMVMRADAIVARAVGAHEVTAADEPRFANLVEELCVRAGLSEPSMHVVESESINAMAFGTTPAAAALAVTTGALRKLKVVELESLLSREIGRLRQGDARIDTLAVPFIRIPLGPFGPLGLKLFTLLRGHSGEAEVDAASMELTRYPPGLIQAFTAMQSSGDPSSAHGPTSHLWTRRPDDETTWSMDDRIQLLREL